MSHSHTIKKPQAPETTDHALSEKVRRYHLLLLTDLTLTQLESKTSTKATPTATVDMISGCPYHGPIIRLVGSSIDRTWGYVGLDRFAREDSDQQPAAFLRPDDNLFSLAKDCTCGQRPEQNASKL